MFMHARFDRRSKSLPSESSTTHLDPCLQLAQLLRNILGNRPICPLCQSRLPPLSQPGSTTAQFSTSNLKVRIFGSLYPAFFAASCSSFTRPENLEYPPTSIAAASVPANAMAMLRLIPLRTPIMGGILALGLDMVGALMAG